MRTILSSQRHDSVVAIRASELVRAGARVCADVEGYPQPPLIAGYRPDIVAYGIRNLISEIETSESWSSSHTQEQLAAFASVPNYQLEVVVPESVYYNALIFYPVSWQIQWRIFSD